MAAKRPQDELITMLAAGFKDDAISRRLGVSPRTMDRRIHDLLDDLGALTRFQGGWLAAHRALDRLGKLPKRDERA